MKADCFPVSVGTENKPDLPERGKEAKLKEQIRRRVGRGVGGLCRPQEWEYKYEFQDLQKNGDGLRVKGQ